MGITKLSLDRINKWLPEKGKLLIIGCQNLYNSENYGDIAHTYFENLGHYVESLDILGCQGSQKLDLRNDLKFKPVFDVVNDCGSKEHIDGPLYQALKNIHEACAVEGTMIHENPRTENWPGHGYHYFTTEFWEFLAGKAGYGVIETCEEPAMGNDVDGWNVVAVLRKIEDKPFISEEAFNKIYKQHIFSK